MFNFRKIFNLKKRYEFEPYFYLDTLNIPVSHVTNKVKTLSKVIIEDTSEEKAFEKAFLFINTNYPHLKGKIILKLL